MFFFWRWNFLYKNWKIFISHSLSEFHFCFYNVFSCRVMLLFPLWIFTNFTIVSSFYYLFISSVSYCNILISNVCSDSSLSFWSVFLVLNHFLLWFFRFYNSLPPISKAYGTLCLLATTAFQLGLYDPMLIALDYGLVFKHFQVFTSISIDWIFSFFFQTFFWLLLTYLRDFIMHFWMKVRFITNSQEHWKYLRLNFLGQFSSLSCNWCGFLNKFR